MIICLVIEANIVLVRRREPIGWLAWLSLAQVMDIFQKYFLYSTSYLTAVLILTVSDNAGVAVIVLACKG